MKNHRDLYVKLLFAIDMSWKMYSTIEFSQQLCCGTSVVEHSFLNYIWRIMGMHLFSDKKFAPQDNPNRL